MGFWKDTVRFETLNIRNMLSTAVRNYTPSLSVVWVLLVKEET